MRHRKIKGAREMLLAHEDYALSEDEAIGKNWSEFFGAQRPLHVELGTGRGKFITGMAELHPDFNFIGIELKEEVLLRAVKRAGDKKLHNVAFIAGNGARLPEYFRVGELERIYINFCDPWPKNRHSKRRLVYRGFLEIYKDLLSDKGGIHFKTDNEKLFEFALNEFSDSGFRLRNISLDLHSSGIEGNVTTEYEERFAALGMKIYRCEAYPY